LDFIKAPFILEFLDVPEDMTGRETDLERAIINNLHIGVNGTKRIIRRLHRSGTKRGKNSRLPDIRKPHNTAIKSHGVLSHGRGGNARWGWE